MDDRIADYRATLEVALCRLQSHVTTGRIAGSDMSQFLLVERNDRGVEIYGNKKFGVVIDPALGEELQGEITYPSFVLALDAAIRWLDGCRLEDLRTGE